MKFAALSLSLILTTAACNHEDTTPARNASSDGPPVGAEEPRGETTPAAHRPGGSQPASAVNTVPRDGSAARQRRGSRDAGSRARSQALVQGGSSAEMNVTADVRRAIMSDDTLSSDAHRVEVATVGSMVTLRGVVNGAAEAEKISSLAESIPGVGDIDNQLESNK